MSLRDLPPDSNEIETARRAEKVTKIVAAIGQYNTRRPEAALTSTDILLSVKNEEFWKGLSSALSINIPSQKTRVMVMKALAEAERIQ